MASIPDAAIRDAIEFAFLVAVIGSRARPPVPSPPALKPFLRFQKIPPAALGPVRKVVEADDEFRERVGIAATEELVGRAGWLWIHRPEGWAAELAQQVADEEAKGAAEASDRAERSARHRADRAQQAARAATAELAAVRAALAAEQSQRHRLEHEKARAERRANQLEIELGGARRRLEQAEADAAEAAATLAALQIEVDRLAEEVTRSALADEAVNPPAAADEGSTGTSAERGAAVVAASGSPAEVAVAEVVVAEAAADEPPAGERAAGLAAALADAAEATSRLAAALAAAAQAAGLPQAEEDAVQDLGEVEATPATAEGPRARRRSRRTPLKLPGGVWADTLEAALHLVKAPGALLVVDGYNVAKLGWPEQPLAEQRTRLLDALDELAARYGTDIRVVFDGADVRNVPGRRRYLQVEFSPAGVSADDVIVELAETVPADRPLIVATNDREVRAGVRAAGANLLASEQLLAVARR